MLSKVYHETVKHTIMTHAMMQTLTLHVPVLTITLMSIV